MLYHIELVAPVAVCYQLTPPARLTSESLPSRAIFCDLAENESAKEPLRRFFRDVTNQAPKEPFIWLKSSQNPQWQPHPDYPELTIGPSSKPLVYCRIELGHDFVETKKDKPLSPEELDVPWLSFYFSTTADIDDVWKVELSDDKSPTLEIGAWGRDASGERGWLKPKPADPYLPLIATDALALEHWQRNELPFRVRRAEDLA